MVRDEWAVFIAFDSPHPETYARDITTFVRSASGAWQRDATTASTIRRDRLVRRTVDSLNGLRQEVSR